MAAPEQLLGGVRILEAGSLAAGTIAGSVLADFGADLIRICEPGGDDPMHAWWGGPYTKDGVYLPHKLQGRNKRHVTLDLRKPAGRDLFHKLVAKADVVLENFRPGTMERWGNDWETLRAINPRLIFCRVSGFGQTGPNAHRRADGRIAEAFAGYSWLAGDPDGPPLHSQMDMGGSTAGMWSVTAIMMALYWRDAQGGRGQVIDIALYEPLFRQMQTHITSYSQGTLSKRSGNRKSGGTPWVDSHTTKDGRYFTYSAATRATMWDQMRAMGATDDPRFADLPTTYKNRHEYHEIAQMWMKERTLAEAVEGFAKFEAAATPVMNAETLSADPHLQAREMIVSVDDPDLGPVRMQGILPKFSRTPGKLRHAGERPGARNREVYGELLGLTDEEIAALGREGAI